MAKIRPFRALRPEPSLASTIAAVPYDVVNTDEARALAAENPLSFLHVSRSEIDLPADTNPYADIVYRTAAERFSRIRAHMVEEAEPALYFYKLRMGTHEQTGLAACYSVDEYDSNLVKKHEKTRRDKEDDRTRHITELRAQTGPVFLTYHASAAVDAVAAKVAKTAPLYDIVAPDGITHTVWKVTGDDLTAVVGAFAALPALYIADGHHRAASAARVRKSLAPAAGKDGVVEADWFLAVAFPDNQTQVLPYNRTVKDLAGLTPEAFMGAVKAAFDRPGGRAGHAREEGRLRDVLRREVVHARHRREGRRRRHRPPRREHPAGPPARPGPEDCRRPDGQADRLRGRDPRDGGAREARDERQGRGGVLDVPRQRGRSHGHRRRGRNHAAEVDMVRAEAPGRAVDSHDARRSAHEGTRRRQVRTGGPGRAQGPRAGGAVPAGAQGRLPGGGAREHEGRHPGRPLHQGHRRDPGGGRALARRPRRGGLRHHRRQERIAARHLRLQLPWQERGGGGGAHLRPHPGPRSAHSRQRGRAAGGAMEQEGVLEGAGPARPHAGHPRLRQHRPGGGPPGAGLRDAPGHLERDWRPARP